MSESISLRIVTVGHASACRAVRQPTRALSTVALIVQLVALAACSGQNTTGIPSYVNGDQGLMGLPPVEVPFDGGLPAVDTSCFSTPTAMKCGVSFSRDIFPKMQSAGAWGCASIACHAASTPPIMSDGDAKQTYTNLESYALGMMTPRYVQPCADPSLSGITCNLGPNSTCGIKMPLMSSGAVDPTSDEIQMISDWVACGAPNN